MSGNTMKGSAGTARAAGASARSTLIVAFAIAAIVFVLDQLSKLWAENTLEHNVAQPLVGDILKLRLIYNSGAAFGLGGSITPIITGVQIGIALAVIVVLVRSVRSRAWAISLSLLLGGALGNIVDRLFRDPGPLTGHVVDFLELPHWPIFNVADIAVTSGAVLLVLLTLVNVPLDAGEKIEVNE
ncbi:MULTISPECIES: signal peptidase II [Dermabacter]|uniref:signal peptidase II n=1 Tax=Dermabacter TaxID=36739 RepID=UPI0021A4708D|nr:MULTISPECIES: signal peptidase II [Dermabacter]MCT1956150.1 signal peptidase II [Dermabacter hominis]MCT2056579.1 signal peptidase II [Dermabacter hominis]MCT2083906.1 signal peptidase II [Dermabacter hominis]MCT2091659.1 signal peptidase II [Dermabacter hominis]MCT2190907.1 signal peptidase II [Dermabacter hominis]